MKKLPKSRLPDNTSFNEFECFGPPATKDAEFSGTKIADFGCFKQDNSSTNKYYHACVCKSQRDGKWYCFYQWGRTGKSTFDFQFVECTSEDEAQKVYEKQCHSKNDKRGEWYKHPQLGRILRAKFKKDCYLVRNMATRLSALPDASKVTTKKTTKVNKTNFDAETNKLLKDLNVGTITYAKSQFSSGLIPDLDSIEEGRKILSLAAKASKAELKELTKILYSKIPKTVGLKEKINLSSDNIVSWLNDLDAFESAYKGLESGTENVITKYNLEYVPHNTGLWRILNRQIEQSTRDRHSYLRGKMKVLNIWKVTNIPDSFFKKQLEIAKSFKGEYFPLVYEPDREDRERKSQTQQLFHGTRSCNVGYILNGFKTPKELSGVTINGAINGPAIYHASDWKKSAGYCSIRNGYWSRGSGNIENRQAFMFINDVILGNHYTISRPRPKDSPPDGYHSVIADTNGSFQNEEFMTYTADLIYPRYLVEFDI